MPAIIVVDDQRWQAVEGLESAVMRAAESVMKRFHVVADASILLADDATLQTLNSLWRGLDKPTNVLSFPSPQDQPIVADEAPSLGDIALSFDTLQREAVEQAKPLVHHASHLTIHGLLHLLDFDHEDDSMALEMETLETTLLAGLGIANPYGPETA